MAFQSPIRNPQSAMEESAIEVIGLGSVAVDDFLFVPEYPLADAKVRVRRRERQCGGLTATALVAAARAGARCAYGGVLGDDEDSCFAIAAFEREGIATHLILRRPEARPIHSTIIVDETRHTRNIFFDLQGSVGADPSHPPEETIHQAKALLIDHYGIEGMTRAAKIARSANVAVVADFERNEWPGFDDLLSRVDHLIVSKDFAAKLTGLREPDRAAAALWRDGRAVVIVTCGETGCWSVEPGGIVHNHPAFTVPVADTTGCGDVFHGAYAAELVRGAGLDERIRFASAAAALKAMHLGGQAGIPRREKVTQFMQAHAMTSE
jgi:sugar/nucleoside kinase (ribokinase family)